MRKAILMAIAGYVWRKIRSRHAGGGDRRSTRGKVDNPF
jgi:hypothetical protein